MIIAIIGTYDDMWLCNPMGNGKSCTMVYLGLMEQNEGRRVYANFHVDFGEKMQVLDMVDRVLTEDSRDYALLIDEIQLIIASEGLKMGTKKRFIHQLVAQSRKRNCNIYYTTQRFRNVHPSLRQVTTQIIWPIKRHIHSDVLMAADQRYICNDDGCLDAHQIEVYRHIPFTPWPLEILRPEVIGKHYNTDEIVIERTE